MRVTPLLGVVLSAGLLVGCGGSSAGLSKSAEAVLQRDAAALASAALSGDGAAVSSALARLRSDLEAQQRSGDVSVARAERVLTAAMAVVEDVSAPVQPTVGPTPAPTVTSAPVVRSPAPSRESEPRKGKGKDGEEKHD